MASLDHGREIEKIVLQTLEDFVDDEMIESVIEEVYVHLPRLRDNLKLAIDGRVVDDAIYCAHSIKGIMSTIGLLQISELAQKCEHTLKEGSFEIEKESEQIFETIDDFMTTKK